jgi:hypothetical protein
VKTVPATVALSPSSRPFTVTEGVHTAPAVSVRFAAVTAS